MKGVGRANESVLSLGGKSQDEVLLVDFHEVEKESSVTQRASLSREQFPSISLPLFIDVFAENQGKFFPIASGDSTASTLGLVLSTHDRDGIGNLRQSKCDDSSSFGHRRVEEWLYVRKRKSLKHLYA